MPGINTGKRGLTARQYQHSKTRMVRSRHPAPSAVADDTTAQKVAKKETVKVTACIPSVCNPLLPDLHCFGNIGFEVLLFMYLHTALFCQYIYLYKTVWWYPVSLPPSTTSLNFHLIDRNLTLFLSIFILRRLLWSMLWDFLRPKSDNAPRIMAWIFLCILCGLLWISFLITPLVQLFYSTSLLNMVVLCYPILLWIPLTGLSGDSCLNLVLSWSCMADEGKLNVDSSEQGNASKKHLDAGASRLLSCSDPISLQSYDSFGCSTDHIQIRKDVKMLCQDFNLRVSEIVFCSMVCAYYVGLVPMFFMQSHQYYDMVWSLQHTVLVLLNSFGLLSSHLLNPRYLNVLHKCALLLRKFDHENENKKTAEVDSLKKDERSSKITSHHIEEASSAHDVGKDTSPNQRGKYGLTDLDDSTNMRFYYMFSNPLRLINWLLAAHVLIVLFQNYLLMTSSKWDHLISIALMQFFSYYVLFRTARDRIVLGKAYLFHTLMYKN